MVDREGGSSAGAPIDAETVCEAFQRIVATQPERVALRSRDDGFRLTWGELDARVRRLAAGLAGLGVKRGDTVAMLLPNRAECHLIDFAAVHLGAVPFTIYNTSTVAQIRYQIGHAGARVLFCETQFLDKVNEARSGLDNLEHVLVVDGAGGTTSYAELERSEAPLDFDAAWQAVQAADPVTIIFTSGTTGPPKAAQWPHSAVMSQLRAIDAVMPLPDENIISFLPLAHAGGRITSHYMALGHGATITACPDLNDLPQYLAEVHPDTVFAVPRLWEKLRVGIEGLIAGIEDSTERKDAEEALALGLRVARGRDAGEATELADLDGAEAEHAARLAALAPVLTRMGLDRVKVAFVGGAPSAPALSQFFRAVGVPLLEAYGLTEGCLMIFNRPDRFKGGTAGLPLPGVELRLAEDGEMLIRSPLNMLGYRDDPEQTAAAMDPEGWLHTGDIGAVDADGFVSIVDRKKEIIINAAGKNMSPANIERAIMGESPVIAQVMAVGDGRRYNTALITVDPDAAARHARTAGVDPVAGAAGDVAEVVAEVERAVEQGNQHLSRVEQIKKFRIVGESWLPDSEEMTPTLKLKRKNIAQKYADEIAALYAES